jgi:LmbE family N-acetylglucosaminyl deacetylase
MSRACVALLCLFTLASPQALAPAEAQSRPAYSRGAVGLGQALGRLRTTASLLHTAAHPDDENTALIARLARGDGARVAYLSVTRGEGGQNALGPELGEALGVIRTEELLQARRLDGGAQFFTRAFDFGFTKTLKESLEKWPEEQVLADMVRVIRAYRPLVVASQFSGGVGDGHGQHQYAGHIVQLAFRAAADPARFPEQLAEGLRPWQPRKFYVSGGFRPTAADASLLPVEVGIYDPLLGRTYYEIAAEGRSQHRSQEMGTLQLRGPQTTRWRLVETMLPPQKEEGLFDGLDLSIRGIERLAGLEAGVITQELAAIDDAVERAYAGFDALHPAKILNHLSEGLAHTRAARARLAPLVAGNIAAYDADFLLAQKEEEFQAALLLAAGVVLDAVADVETAVPGEAFHVTVRLFLPAGSAAQVAQYALRVPAGWQVAETGEPAEAPAQRFRRAEVTPHSRVYRVTVAGAAPTTPYYLQQPRDGYLYRWPAGSPQALPFAPALATAEVMLEVNGAQVIAAQPVHFRYADDIRGELRPVVNVVPAVTLSLDPGLLVVNLPAQAEPRRISAQVCSHARRPLAGALRLNVPAGWQVSPPGATFRFAARGACHSYAFDVTLPARASQGEHRIAAEAQVEGQTYRHAQQVVSYPHIETHRLYHPAEARVQVLDLKVAPVRVGYVMGSGDEVPEAIRRMGLDVTLLGEQDLARGDLSRFDTIVVGIKAANVRPDLIANNSRLLDFARQGGTLIVQFQQSPFLEHKLAPFPVEINNFAPGRARVSVEEAPVTVLQPAHPLFHFPNRITAEDWQGWVHERGLYFFTQWAPEFTPLLESADPGEAPQRGGHMYARLGKGHYIYTGYAWFRQLPAGVPGAYRLFANLLSLPKAPPQPEAAQ